MVVKPTLFYNQGSKAWDTNPFFNGKLCFDCLHDVFFFLNSSDPRPRVGSGHKDIVYRN